MKKQILILLITLLTYGARGQTYRYQVKGQADQSIVTIRNLSAEVFIKGISGNEIVIKAEDYEGIPEKAKGLSPLSATGPDNTRLGLNLSEEGSTIVISGVHRGADKAAYTLSLPSSVILNLDYQSYQADNIYVEGMKNEVEIKSMVSQVELVDVTGPLVVHTLSADVNATFTGINQESPSSISSVSGDIDVTFPETAKGNFKLSSTSGGIYTDMDFEFRKGEESMVRTAGGMSARPTLNGGGVEFVIKSVSGDIYIRKGP